MNKVSAAIYVAVILAGAFFIQSFYEWMTLPIVVRSITTGKPILIINSDGTQMKVTRLTVIPKKHQEIWENPEELKR